MVQAKHDYQTVAKTGDNFVWQLFKTSIYSQFEIHMKPMELYYHIGYLAETNFLGKTVTTTVFRKRGPHIFNFSRNRNYPPSHPQMEKS